MARIERGILGSVKGTVGTVTGSKWKQTEYIRVKSGKRTGKPTSRQLIQRARFALVVAFASAMKFLCPEKIIFYLGTGFWSKSSVPGLPGIFLHPY